MAQSKDPVRKAQNPNTLNASGVRPHAMARQKLMLLAALTLFWIAAIAIKLTWLQVFQYSDYIARAAKQQQRTIEVAPKRGIIYDRNGNALAMTVDVDSVFAVPTEIPDKANTAAMLARVLHLDAHELQARLENAHNFMWVARKLDNDTAQRVRALNLRGIAFQKESKRFYPKRELAAQVLGYVGMDDAGLAGIERSLDDDLHGHEGKMLITMDAKRRWFGRVEKQPEAGSNVVLTIDQNIQWIAERELDAAVQQTHAISGVVVVQNPRTGEVLALANRPTFDPNASGRDPATLKDHALSDIYEPGSTFKMVTYSAALDGAGVKPEDMVDCQGGAMTLYGRTLHDDHSDRYGVVTVRKALEVSSDVGAAKMALKVGPEKFYGYMRSFGFGQRTGIELPGETRGILRPTKKWQKTSILSLAIGQEVGVTPLQIASMTSTMANDGIYTPPRIIAGVLGAGAAAASAKYVVPEQHRVISSYTAAQMRSILEGVIVTGTGKKAGLNGWSAAGKTGTAQKIDPRTHRYGNKSIASFSGFAPVNNPAITVTVVLDSPIGAHHGGDTAAPVFARVAQQVLTYLNVPSDSQIDPKKRVLTAQKDIGETDSVAQLDFDDDSLAADSDVTADSAATAASNDAARVVNASYQESQKATKQKIDFTPAASADPGPEPVAADDGASAHVDAGAGIVVDTDDPTVPSFAGLTVRSALEQAQAAGVDIVVIGSGIAQQQSRPAGTKLHPGERVTVWFKR